MQIYTSIETFRPSGAGLVLGLGNFDGFHRGHQALLQCVIEKARLNGGQAAAFTFRSHPQSVLRPDAAPGLLTSVEHKMILLKEFGLDICFLVPFTRTFSETQAADFVEEILVERFHVREVVLGYNAHFGHDRIGDGRLMHELADRFRFKFEEMEPVKVGSEFVSSTRIRRLVQTGQLAEAEEQLGRPFGVLGTVLAGDGRGRAIGYPTANLQIKPGVMPPEGVYPVRVREVAWTPLEIGEGFSGDFDVESKSLWMQGVLNYGRRPTFPSPSQGPVAEVHLLDFEGDLYSKRLEVAFYPPLRTERVFKNSEALGRQIREDICKTRGLFSTPSKSAGFSV